jgi:hypothetical protein
MKSLFLAGFVIASSLFIASCSATGLSTLNSIEEHFKDRGCGSNGTLIIKGATVTSLPAVDGTYTLIVPRRFRNGSHY